MLSVFCRFCTNTDTLSSLVDEMELYCLPEGIKSLDRRAPYRDCSTIHLDKKFSRKYEQSITCSYQGNKPRQKSNSYTANIERSKSIHKLVNNHVKPSTKLNTTLSSKTEATLNTARPYGLNITKHRQQKLNGLESHIKQKDKNPVEGNKVMVLSEGKRTISEGKGHIQLLDSTSKSFCNILEDPEEIPFTPTMTCGNKAYIENNTNLVKNLTDYWNKILSQEISEQKLCIERPEYPYGKTTWGSLNTEDSVQFLNQNENTLNSLCKRENQKSADSCNDLPQNSLCQNKSVLMRKINCDRDELRTIVVLKMLQKVVDKVKGFPNSYLRSQELKLSDVVKYKVSDLVQTLLTENNEAVEEHLVLRFHENHNNSSLIIGLMMKPLMYEHLSSSYNTKIKTESDHETCISRGLTMYDDYLENTRKALNRLMLMKECLWLSFIFNEHISLSIQRMADRSILHLFSIKCKTGLLVTCQKIKSGRENVDDKYCNNNKSTLSKNHGIFESQLLLRFDGKTNKNLYLILPIIKHITNDHLLKSSTTNQTKKAEFDYETYIPRGLMVTDDYLENVSDSLNKMMMLKELLWLSVIFSDDIFSSRLRINGRRNLPLFTIKCEQNLIICQTNKIGGEKLDKNYCDSDNFQKGYDSFYCIVWVIENIAKALEALINSIWVQTIYHWPIIVRFVNMTYQLLVPLIVWHIIEMEVTEK